MPNDTEELWAVCDSCLVKNVCEHHKFIPCDIVKDKITTKFLKACKSVGIKKVVINIHHKLVRASVNWRFHPFGSAFACGQYKGWPAIWNVAEQLKMDGFGNRNHHSVYGSFLNSGAYKYENNKWNKID